MKIFFIFCWCIIVYSSCNFAEKKQSTYYSNDTTFYIGKVEDKCFYNSNVYDTTYIDTIKVSRAHHDSIEFFYGISNCELSSFGHDKVRFQLNDSNFYTLELGNSDFNFTVTFHFHNGDSLTFDTDYFAYEKDEKNEEKFKSHYRFRGKKIIF